MTSSDNFFQSNAQKLESAILELSISNPELFQPPVPDSQEAKRLEKIRERFDEISNLSVAEVEAYYKEHGYRLDIDRFSMPKNNNTEK